MPRWFGSASCFESLVRGRLKQKVELGLGRITLFYPIYVALASTTPILTWWIPKLFQADDFTAWLVLEHIAQFSKNTLVALLSTLIIKLVCRLGACVAHWRGLTSFLLACATLAAVSGLWVPLSFIDEYTKNLSGLLIIPCIIAILLVGRLNPPKLPEVDLKASEIEEDTFSV